ncbi:MAG: exodeoxyribonuclease VII large subunit [Campylobacterales bacterium]
MTPISVSDLNLQIKALLENTFAHVRVTGEIGRVTYHTSGHVYFSLKDENATVDCVLFRGNATKLKFRLETGLKVVLEGAVTVFAPQGKYQINCFSVEPAGAGALALAYEQLKKKLSALGWFDPEHKKPLPKYPQSVALVTSATGAALQDMRNVAARRWHLTKLICINVLVQGEGAPESLVKGLRYADTLGVDAIVLARGGGSMEDLWGFNSEAVAKAVYELRTPCVSAVGHEIDTVITDFVADVRAPTPSAAIELLLPDVNEERMRVDDLRDQIDRRLMLLIAQKTALLNHLRESFAHFSLAARFKRHEAEIAQLHDRLRQTADFHYRRKLTELTHLQERFAAADPAKRLPQKTAQLLIEGRAVAVGELSSGARFEAIDAHYRALAEVLEVAPL